MRERSGHYSIALQAGLALSLCVGVALAIVGAYSHARSDAVRLAIQDLRARGAELVALIEARQKDRVTEPYLRAQLSQWDRAVGDLDEELADAKEPDPRRADARARVAELRTIAAGVRAAPGGVDAAAHDAALRATQALIDQERAGKR